MISVHNDHIHLRELDMCIKHLNSFHCPFSFPPSSLPLSLYIETQHPNRPPALLVRHHSLADAQMDVRVNDKFTEMNLEYSALNGFHLLYQG